MKRFGLVWLILTVWCANAAAGDLVSSWKAAEGGIMTLAVRDAGHIRMDSSPDNYMLLSGKKVYAVARENGQWTAMDMDQMSGMMKMFGGGAAAPADQKVVYTNTGRSETIAGYKGSVYVAEIRDAEGKTVDRGEIVFSKAADIVRLNEAWIAFAQAMGRIAGPELSQQLDAAARQAQTSGYGGFIRVDTDLRLASVKTADLGGAYFDLPDGAAMSALPGRPDGDASGGDSGSAVSGAASDAAKVTGRKIDSAAGDDAKGATVDEVREEVRGLFNKIFNKD